MTYVMELVMLFEPVMTVCNVISDVIWTSYDVCNGISDVIWTSYDGM